MKSEPELTTLWPQIQQRGSAALHMHFARRVMQRVAAARDEFNARQTMVVGLSTALACLALTLAVNLWSVSDASDEALDQWRAFNVDDSVAANGF